MRPFVVNAEIGVGKAGTPVAELGKQSTGLAFVGFEGARRRAINRARMPVVFAHPDCRIGNAPLFGDRVLGIERECVVITARLAVQVATQPGKEMEILLEFVGNLGSGHVSAIGSAQLVEPADQLVVAQTARRGEAKLEARDARAFGDRAQRTLGGLAIVRVNEARERGRRGADARAQRGRECRTPSRRCW